jgi:site-specific DNA-cytosine methylase
MEQSNDGNVSLPPSEKVYYGRHKIEELHYLTPEFAQKHPTAISLFTGAGGAALGVRQAGFEVRVMVEWEKAAVSTLKANWTQAGHDAWIDRQITEIRSFETRYPSGHRGNYKKGEKWSGPNRKSDRDALVGTLQKWKAQGWGRKGRKGGWWQPREPAILHADITQLSTADILKAGDLRVGEATILEGGFPCQGFSMANNNRGMHDARNFLYLECVRVIREALPRTFLLENVPGLISMEKGKIIRMIVNDLANSGYQVNWDVLNAADYGVPQHRKRVFIIGQRNDVMVFPNHGDACVPQLHIGGAAGPFQHPSWFEGKYPEKTQLSLFDALTAYN